MWSIERRHFQWPWTTPTPVWRSRHSLTLNISETVWHTDITCNVIEIPIGTYTRSTQQCRLKWPWVILSDLENYSMTRSVARSVCDSWASCWASCFLYFLAFDLAPYINRFIVQRRWARVWAGVSPSHQGKCVGIGHRIFYILKCDFSDLVGGVSMKLKIVRSIFHQLGHIVSVRCGTLWSWFLIFAVSVTR